MPLHESCDPGAAKSLRYDYAIDPDSDTTAARVVRLVGARKRVLELGCAAGSMSRVFRDRGCSVVAVEIDASAAARAAAFCERVIVADVEAVDFARELGGEAFDVVVAADVLEHLRDPGAVLRRLKGFLRPDGLVVASIPNVAHGSVRLALWGGAFPYGEVGLLDATHLRFYTRDSMEELFLEAGLLITRLERQTKSLEGSEVPHDACAAAPDLIAALSEDEEAATYQFVLAARLASPAAVDAVRLRARELSEEKERARREVRRLRRALDDRSREELRAARLVEENEAWRREAARVSEVIAAQRELRDRVEELAGRHEAELASLRAALEAAAERFGEWAQPAAGLREAAEARLGALRELVEKQGAGLRDALDAQDGRVAALGASLAEAHEEILLRLEQLEAGIRRAAPAPASDPAPSEAGAAAGGASSYPRLVARIRDVVARALPSSATIAVVSRGDDALLQLGGRRAWHFPQRDDGVYAGHYPEDSDAAIAHLEGLRARGADFLLFPGTALWWLEHYDGLRRHLEARYRVAERAEGTCLVFALREPAAGRAADEPRVEPAGYPPLARQIREIVRSLLPQDATVLVVSRGDGRLLELEGRRGWHFPQAPNGVYAGYYPADSAAAIAHLEMLRAKGADFLLLPSTSLWWLEHYREFAEHLGRRYRLITRQTNVCVVFGLARPSPRGRTRPTQPPAEGHA